MRRRGIRALLAGGAAFVAAIVLAFVLFGGGAPTTAEAPANVAELQHIGRKNDRAATVAAARMRADSHRRTNAAENLLASNTPTSPAPAPAR
jgi:hypothetical protein